MEIINTTLYEEGTGVELNPSTVSSQVKHHDSTVEKALDETVNFTPQDLTPEQQTQARENINALEDEAGVIDEEHIATGAVTSDKLADTAVTEDKLASQSVSSKKIKDATIGASKLGKDSVTTAKIKDGAVTKEKLASGVIDENFIILKDISYSGTTILPDDLALRLFRKGDGGKFTMIYPITQGVYFLCPSRIGGGSVLLPWAGQGIYQRGNDIYQKVYFASITGTDLDSNFVGYGKNNFLSPPSYASLEFHVTLDNHVVIVSVIRDYLDVTKILSGGRNQGTHFISCSSQYKAGAQISLQDIAKFPLLLYNDETPDIWRAVSYLSTAQVEALLAKVTEQFGSVSTIKAAYVSLSVWGSNAKLYTEGDDISGIAAVFTGANLYFFKE